MTDLIYSTIGFVFFAACWLMTKACDKL